MIRWDIKRNKGDRGYWGNLGEMPCFELDAFNDKWTLRSHLPGQTKEYFTLNDQGTGMKKAEALVVEWLRATGLASKR